MGNMAATKDELILELKTKLEEQDEVLQNLIDDGLVTAGVVVAGPMDNTKRTNLWSVSTDKGTDFYAAPKAKQGLLAYDPNKLCCGVKVRVAGHLVVQILEEEKVHFDREITKVVEILDKDKNEVVVRKGEARMVAVDLTKTAEAGDDVEFMLGTITKISKKAPRKDSAFRPVHWDEIGGLEGEKVLLKSLVRRSLGADTLKTVYKYKAPGGVLLYGEPGNGKTMLARAVVTEVLKQCGKDFVPSAFSLVSGPQLVSKWVGETEENIRSVFLEARKHRNEFGYPCVIVFDEADSVFPTRGGEAYRHSDSVVSEVLSRMDGAESSGDPLVIMTTNRRDMIDPALLRPGRLDVHVHIKSPDEDSAAKVLLAYLGQMPFGPGFGAKKATNLVVKHFYPDKKASGALLANIANTIAKKAMDRDLLENRTEPSGIQSDDVLQALAELQ